MRRLSGALFLLATLSAVVGCGGTRASSVENLHLASNYNATAFSAKYIMVPRDGDYTLRMLVDDTRPLQGIPVARVRQGQSLGLSCDDQQVVATIDGQRFATLHDDGDIGWVRLLTPAEDRKLAADTAVGNTLLTAIEVVMLPIAPIYILTAALISPHSPEHAMVFGGPAERASP